ncbi:hypothetical protein [Schaalia cardiffensis]|uniref:hypothetical protein n=1 Tax=Schaalia cardiffensis TaxID=181487 RepID=UPI0023F4F916|nr:hypothetical protein [Schaalia cardiffensis]
METEWWKYVQSVIGSDSFTEAANRAGFDKSAFTRWKKGANADPAFAVALARGYGRNVLESLVASGLITLEEAGATVVHVGAEQALHEADDMEIVREILRRIQREPESDHPMLVQPVDSDHPAMRAHEADVTEIRLQANPVDYDEDAGDMTADDDVISFNRPSSRGQGRYETGDPDVGDLQAAANEDARDPRAEVADREQRRRDLNL